MIHKPPVPIITVDGPSGSGKGTLSLAIAKALGWHFLDSGAIYRSLALKALKEHLKLNQIELQKLNQEENEIQQIEAKLVQLASNLDVIFADEVILDGEKVTNKLRTEQCGNMASKIAILPKVRQALLRRQRAFCKPPGLVADGRDMGTVVFKEAFLKIYLTASARARANRRYSQLKDTVQDVNLQSLLVEIEERDARDKQRAIAPLKPAEDALVIDTSTMGIEEVFSFVMNEIKQRLY